MRVLRDRTAGHPERKEVRRGTGRPFRIFARVSTLLADSHRRASCGAPASCSVTKTDGDTKRSPWAVAH